jgi:hypothetical protein
VGGARQRAGDAVSPGTAVNTFLCRASQITHDKELCRASPFPKAHGKVLSRVKMRRGPFAVRSIKMRTAKAVPCVFLSPAHGKARESGSVCLCLELFPPPVIRFLISVSSAHIKIHS